MELSETNIKISDIQAIKFSFIGKMCTLSDYQQARSFFANIDAGNKCIILDFSKLTFISSHAIGTIVAAFNMYRKNGINFFIANPRPEIAEVLELSGVTQIIPIIKSDNDIKDLLKNS